jgi:hypothetical protein
VGAGFLDCVLFSVDGWVATRNMDPFLRLADYRVGYLFRVEPEANRRGSALIAAWLSLDGAASCNRTVMIEN